MNHTLDQNDHSYEYQGTWPAQTLYPTSTNESLSTNASSPGKTLNSFPNVPLLVATPSFTWLFLKETKWDSFEGAQTFLNRHFCNKTSFLPLVVTNDRVAKKEEFKWFVTGLERDHNARETESFVYVHPKKQIFCFASILQLQKH